MKEREKERMCHDRQIGKRRERKGEKGKKEKKF